MAAHVRSHPLRARWLIAVWALTWPLAASWAVAETREAALDSRWKSRGEVLQEGQASPERIVALVDGYRALHEAQPDDARLRWKLLRALHFAVDFSALAEEQKDEYVREAIALCESGRSLVDDASLSPDTRARLSFWQAIARGMEAQRIGLLTLVRRGTATKMFENARLALELDASVDQGGPLRLLSRLHATLPRVPFVSGWVDRDRALPLAEQAYALDPSHPGNRLVLALTLLDVDARREGEARELLQSVVEAEPREGFEAEDAAIQREADNKLAASST